MDRSLSVGVFSKGCSNRSRTNPVESDMQRGSRTCAVRTNDLIRGCGDCSVALDCGTKSVATKKSFPRASILERDLSLHPSFPVAALGSPTFVQHAYECCRATRCKETSIPRRDIRGCHSVRGGPLLLCCTTIAPADRSHPSEICCNDALTLMNAPRSTASGTAVINAVAGIILDRMPAKRIILTATISQKGVAERCVKTTTMTLASSVPIIKI